MELLMKQDLEQVVPKELEFNYEELKAELEQRLEYYNNLVVTEDTIKEGKAERAALNKFKEAVDKYRKDVKKRYMQPYTDFEGKVKELTGLIDQPIKAIDGQLAVFEEQRKQEKQAQVLETYERIVPEELRAIIPFERIEDKRWLNATTTMKKVEDDLEAQVKRVNADLLAINTVPEQYQAGVKAKYIETLDIQAAMNELEAQRKAEEAFRRKQEDERIAREYMQPKQEEEPKQAPVEEIHFPDPQEKKYKLCLEFHLTINQAELLKAFLTENHIDYTKM